MIIAVTHEMGRVFQHFGHTEQFKLYEVEGSEIKKISFLNTNGSGHGALAGFLKENGVDILICGGIGGGAQNALNEAGIKFFGGVQGSADAAVIAYLRVSSAIIPMHAVITTTTSTVRDIPAASTDAIKSSK